MTPDLAALVAQLRSAKLFIGLSTYIDGARFADALESLAADRDRWKERATYWNDPLGAASLSAQQEQAQRERAESLAAENARLKELCEDRQKWRSRMGLTPSCDALLERAERAEAERDALRLAGDRLRDACNGMIGLVQLIASRDDLPTGLDDLMLLSHRVTEAKAAIDSYQEYG